MYIYSNTPMKYYKNYIFILFEIIYVYICAKSFYDKVQVKGSEQKGGRIILYLLKYEGGGRVVKHNLEYK
jgi:hypothetical protein